MKFRRAVRDDLEAIVAMFADDDLGRARDDASLPLDQRYLDAFAALEADDKHYLLVAEGRNRVIAFLQITFIPGLSRLGSTRGQIESVRVSSDLRGQGVGSALTKEAIRLCREYGCALVQLTTDVSRAHTRSFYERFGFEATHHGMKLVLEK